MARVYTTYRRELSYGRRFVCSLEYEHQQDDEQPDGTQPGRFEEAAPQPPQYFEAIREAIDALSESDRFLIEEIVWSGCSEEEIGCLLGMSQKRVSRRKLAALKFLREHFETSARDKDSLTVSV